MNLERCVRTTEWAFDSAQMPVVEEGSLLYSFQGGLSIRSQTFVAASEVLLSRPPSIINEGLLK